MTSSYSNDTPEANSSYEDSILNSNYQVWAKKELASGLYIVSTPIGNLRDITLRALDVLASADEVWSEDTRQTQKLLGRYSINVKLSSYNDHNAANRRPLITEALKNGKTIALVSDAGTPLISDPGWKLVNEAIKAGANIIPIPGASASLAGLVASGLPSDRFFFTGFLPSKRQARRKALNDLSAIPSTLIFFERSSRLEDTLRDIGEVFGINRQVVIARELSKLFEEVRRGTVKQIIESVADKETPKGEIVLMVGPPMKASVDMGTTDVALKVSLRTKSVKDAVDEVSSQLGISKRSCYQRALEIKEKMTKEE